MYLRNLLYHLDCFNCAVCISSLKPCNLEENIEFYFNEDKLPICEVCHLKNIPKCFKCKKYIQGGKYVNAFKAKFCPECFVCFICKKQLIGQYRKDESNPLKIGSFCEDCYRLKYPEDSQQKMVSTKV